MINSFIYNINSHNIKTIKYLCSKNCYEFSPNADTNHKKRSALANLCKNGMAGSKGLENFIKTLEGKNCSPDLINLLATNYISHLWHLDKEEKSDVLLRMADYYNYLNDNKEKLLNSKSQKVLDNFFSEYRKELMYATFVYDDVTMKTLFSKRLNNVMHFLNSFEQFHARRLEVLKDLTECKKTDGKELTPNEKLQLLQLVNAFSYSLDIGVEKLYDAIEKGVIDFQGLQIDLFRQIIRFLDFSESEVRSFPEDKILEWSFEYVPLVLKAKNDNEETFTDLIKAASSGNYKAYLLDKTNEYGKANSKTQEAYSQNGIDFEKSLNPSKENEVRFVAVDENLEILSNSIVELMENIVAIRVSPLKQFFDKRYKKFIKNDLFILPENLSKSKDDLKNFVQNLLTQLEPAWKQAEKNLNTSRRLTAQNTLTIKDHLETILSNLKSIEAEKIEKTLDLTIKMWDRYPQRDFAQGNFSDCCIGLDRANGRVIADYLLNLSVNMIEIIDNTENKTIGNALCFFAKDENDEPVFVLDNVEINPKYKPSDKVGEKLKNAIKEYAQNFTHELTGRKDIPIYLGINNNDIPKAKELTTKKIKFLGELNCKSIYLDIYNGWIKTNNLDKEVTLEKLT